MVGNCSRYSVGDDEFWTSDNIPALVEEVVCTSYTIWSKRNLTPRVWYCVASSAISGCCVVGNKVSCHSFNYICTKCGVQKVAVSPVYGTVRWIPSRCSPIVKCCHRGGDISWPSSDICALSRDPKRGRSPGALVLRGGHIITIEIITYHCVLYFSESERLLHTRK